MANEIDIIQLIERDGTPFYPVTVPDAIPGFSNLEGRVQTLENKATAVSISGTLASGKAIGTITIDGTPTAIYAPANYALSEITGADDLKKIEALTGTSGLLKKTAANTWALDTNSYLTTEAAESTYVSALGVSEEASFLYRKSPDVGNRDYFVAKSVKGKTLVWNQLVHDGNFPSGTDKWASSTAAALSISGNTAHVSAASTPNASAGFQPQLYEKSGYRHEITIGHKYLLSFMAKLGSDSALVQLNFRHGSYAAAYSLSTSWSRIDRVIVANDASSYLLFWQYEAPSSSVYTADFYIKDVRVFDLTLMFGAGNEPATVEEFESMFPLPYYDYNPGELISFNAEGIQTVGFNQWDEEWERGDIAGSGNTPGQNSDGVYLRSKNYIPALPNTLYCISSVNEQGVAARRWVIYEYDDAKNFLGYTALNSLVATFTTKAKTRFFRFRNNKDTTTYYNDICINLSDPAKNGTYEPYKKPTLNLSIPSMTSGGVQIFPDGMRAAGSVCDSAIVDSDGYIRKVTKRIGDANLGTFTWKQDGTSNFWYIDSIKITENIVTSKGWTYSEKGNDDDSHIYMSGSGYPEVYRENTDAASVKSSMSGVMLYYELATPVSYTLDEPIFVGAGFNGGGIQTVIQENTSEPHTTPFSGSFEYGRMPAMDVISLVNESSNMITSRYLPLTGGTLTGNLTAPSFIKTGGTSSQFLKADGSVDSNAYLPLTGGTMSGAIKFPTGNREILHFAGTDSSWGSGLKYSWSNRTAIAFWGKHAETAFVWNAGTDYSATDVPSSGTSYDFKIQRVSGVPNVTTTGKYIGTAFVKKDGTSSQFLKADGSVDSNTYGRVYSYSLAETSSVDVSFSGVYHAMIIARGTHAHEPLILVGGGYGVTNVRNRFNQISTVGSPIKWRYHSGAGVQIVNTDTTVVTISVLVTYGAAPTFNEVGYDTTSAFENYTLLTTLSAASTYVTDLGTSGDNITWTKNGVANSLTVPYATKAAQDGSGNTITSHYVTLSTNQTITSEKTFSSANYLRFAADTNTIISPGYANVVSYSPLLWNAWHDHFAFLRSCSIQDVQYSTDGTAWSESSTDIKPLFIHKETTSITVLRASDLAFRFTLYSNNSFHACGIEWLVFGVNYTSPFSAFDLKAEYSADNTTWTTWCEGNITVGQSTFYIRVGNLASNQKYIRFTFTKTTNTTTGYVQLNTFSGLTRRKGNQGQGREYSYPYKWDATPNVYPISNNTSYLGTESYRWANVYSVFGDFSGALSVTGNTTLGGTLTVGTSSANKATTLYGTLTTRGDITTYGRVYVGAGRDSGSFIGSNTTENIYLHNSAGTALVADGLVVRRGALEATATLGSTSYRWSGVYSTTGNFSDALTLSGTTSATRRIYFGDTSHYLELDSTGFHFSHGVYSDSFISAGGVSQSGGSGGPIEINTDDFAEVDGVLQLADRTTSNGMGYIILRKDMSFASQITKTNTIYEVRYSFNLSGASVTIPSNCVLKFVGGMLVNGTVTGTNTKIDAPFVRIFSDNISLAGTWALDKFPVSWYGGEVNDSSVDISVVISKILEQFVTIFPGRNASGGHPYGGAKITLLEGAYYAKTPIVIYDYSPTSNGEGLNPMDGTSACEIEGSSKYGTYIHNSNTGDNFFLTNLRDGTHRHHWGLTFRFLTFIGGNGIKMVRPWDFHIEHCTFYNGATAIKFFATVNTHINDCSFYNTVTAIEFDSSMGGGGVSTTFTIENCWIAWCRIGFKLSSIRTGDGFEFIIRNTIFEYCRASLQVQSISERNTLLIDECYFEGNPPDITTYGNTSTIEGVDCYFRHCLTDPIDYGFVKNGTCRFYWEGYMKPKLTLGDTTASRNVTIVVDGKTLYNNYDNHIVKTTGFFDNTPGVLYASEIGEAGAVRVNVRSGDDMNEGLWEWDGQGYSLSKEIAQTKAISYENSSFVFSKTSADATFEAWLSGDKNTALVGPWIAKLQAKFSGFTGRETPLKKLLATLGAGNNSALWQKIKHLHFPVLALPSDGANVGYDLITDTVRTLNSYTIYANRGVYPTSGGGNTGALSVSGVNAANISFFGIVTYRADTLSIGSSAAECVYDQGYRINFNKRSMGFINASAEFGNFAYSDLNTEVPIAFAMSANTGSARTICKDSTSKSVSETAYGAGDSYQLSGQRSYAATSVFAICDGLTPAEALTASTALATFAIEFGILGNSNQ